MKAAAVVDALKYLEQYGALLAAAKRGLELVSELRTFVKEHRDVSGVTDEERARIDALLELEPGDVQL